MAEYLFDRMSQVVHVKFGGAFGAAEKLGRDPADIERWCNGKVSPPIGFAIAMCRAAGVSLDWLAFGHPHRMDLRDESVLTEEWERMAQEEHDRQMAVYGRLRLGSRADGEPDRADVEETA